MKHPNRLIHGLRVLFGALRILVLLGLICWPFSLMLALRNSHYELSFGRVKFSNDSVPIRVVQNSLNTEALAVKDLEGSLVVKNRPARSEMRPFSGWAHPTQALIGGIFFLLLFHLFWRLCRNAERGEIFTEGNLKLVRASGGLLIAYSLASFLVRMWIDYRIGHYVAEQVSIQGIKAITMWSRPEMLIHPHIDRFVTGLLVLALAEVFRHGLALKQETDLTV